MKIHPVEQPYYGAGIEWAKSLRDDIMERTAELELFELIPENFFSGRNADVLKRLRDYDVPTMIHGVELSFGTDEPLKQNHLDEMIRVADQVNAVNLSDHLCLTEAGGVEIGQLTPLPWTIEACDVVCRKVDQIQSQLKIPFLIENITNRFIVPGAELSETQFINRILARTGCHFLLDLNNVHTNATNFKFDPYEWIDDIDLSRVLAIHLAGGYTDEEGILVDSHSAVAPPRVWDLFRYVCNRILPSATIFEWTDNLTTFTELMGEVEHANKILAESPRAKNSHSSRPSSTAFVGEVLR